MVAFDSSLIFCVFFTRPNHLSKGLTFSIFLSPCSPRCYWFEILKLADTFRTPQWTFFHIDAVYWTVDR